MIATNTGAEIIACANARIKASAVHKSTMESLFFEIKFTGLVNLEKMTDTIIGEYNIDLWL